MGYALFAQRKVSLVAQIAELQYQLMDIANEKHKLVQYDAVVADGCITPEEIIDNFNIAGALYKTRDGEFAQLNSDYELDAEDAIAGMTFTGVDDIDVEQKKQEAKDHALQKIRQEWVQKVREKQIAVQESALDQKQKKIETQLTALQQELQSVEQAEGQAIQNATPKYAGLG